MGGEAGFGIRTTGEVLARAFARGGLHLAMNTEVPSLIRGGHNTFQISAAPWEIHSYWDGLDVLIALNEESVDEHLHELVPGGSIIYDSNSIPKFANRWQRHDVNWFPIPLTQIAKDKAGKDIARNAVSLGCAVQRLGFDFDVLSKAISDSFGGKRLDLAQSNVLAAESGFEYMRITFSGTSPATLRVQRGVSRLLLTGNDAIALGAIQAGCKFLAAYPMTPASPILHFMAAIAEQYGIAVRQVEDEIAAITMAIGASFAGVRAMASTSGGGFSLMVEGLGLAAMTETPVVVCEVQRPGPSTGLPTRTEQGDLLFILSCSQGEFVRVVLAPGDIEECFTETFRAFNLAERYQVPAIVISDKFLSEGHHTIDAFPTDGLKIDRGRFLEPSSVPPAGGGFKRFEITETGVSPRTIPGTPGTIHHNPTDEHDEEGVINEDPDNRSRMVEKRLRKTKFILEEMPPPKRYGPADAEALLVGWGSTKGPALDALGLLAARGHRVAYLHNVSLWPFPAAQVEAALANAPLTIGVENNATGQLARLIRMETGRKLDRMVLKYSGRAFTSNELAERVQEGL